MRTPVSVGEAASIRGLSEEAIIKAIRTGRLVAVQLNARGWMLCREQVEGRKFSEPEFRKLCGRYVSVPEACEICHKTDAAIIRDLKSGVIDGFKLNDKAWAVLKSSAEKEFRDYLANSKGRVGRKRDLGGSRSPRSLRKKQPLQMKRARLQSQRGAN